MLDVINKFSYAIAKETGLANELVFNTISLPKSQEQGDIASTIAFKIAKEKGGNVYKIAQDLESIDLDKYNLSGFRLKAINGFLNLYADNKNLLFSSYTFERKKRHCIIEGPSVNPNKPWHIGHLRNALICMAISNIMHYYGYDVIRMDYINDLGLQVAQSYWYYKKFGKTQNTGKFDFDIGLDYIKANELAEKEENIKEIAELMKNIEAGKEQGFKEFIRNVVNAQRETAREYGVRHDFAIYESDVIKLFDDGIRKIKALKNVEMPEQGEYKDCVVIKINDANQNDNQYKVIVRSNGIPTYLGKDIIFHMFKAGHLCCILFKSHNGIYESSDEGLNFYNVKDPIIINVIGQEQQPHQNVLKKALVEMGIINENDFFHVSYGHVRKKEERFSGRKGTWIGFTADDLLNEGIARIERGDKKKIALAAIKYSMLRMANNSIVVFDWDKALKLDGASGVYLLYAYARANSILNKVKSDIADYNAEYKEMEKKQLSLNVVLNEDERAVARLIWQFPYYVQKSANTFEPNVIADYAFELANAFNTFYEKYKIISEDKEQAHKRLFLTKRFLAVIKTCLELLNIDTLEII
ncbi:MAG: arginine--tRNA ligase [Candidatus Anstonellales archaeon]